MGRFSQRMDEDLSNNARGEQYMDWPKISIESAKDFYKIENRKEATKVIEHLIDIVPYIVGKKHPGVAKGRLAPGDLDYGLSVWVHRNIGPGHHDLLCPKNYGKPCPLCDLASERYEKFGKDDAEYKAVKAKQRIVHYVLDATTESLKPLILEQAHYSFEKPLLEEAKIEGEKAGTGTLDFADPDQNITVCFRSKGHVFAGRPSHEIDKFWFEARDKTVSDKIWDLSETLPPLDDALILHTPEEIMNYYYGGTEEAFAEEPPIRGRSARVTSRENIEEEAPARVAPRVRVSAPTQETPSRLGRRGAPVEEPADEEEEIPRGRMRRRGADSFQEDSE